MVDKVFEDTTVDQSETYRRLQRIIEHCRELQNALDDAEQNQR